jgi:vitamin B12 transporter
MKCKLFYTYKPCWIVLIILLFEMVSSYRNYAMVQVKKLDSLREYKTSEVIVVSKRDKLDRQSSSVSSLSVMDSTEIAVHGSLQLAESLSLLPGVYIQNYGGLNGLKTVSLRGATSAQTNVTLEGLRLNASSNGGVDLSLLPSSLISSVQVERSGNSNTSNSLAGSIAIELSTPKRNSLAVSYGSFNELHGNAVAVLKPSSNHQISFVADYLSSKGDYPFEFNEFGEIKTLRRSNSQVENISLYGQWRSTTPSDSTYQRSIVHVVGRVSDRGAPGSVVQGFIYNGNATIKEQDWMILGGVTLYKTSSSSLNLRGFTRQNIMKYTDPDFIGRGLNVTYTGMDNGLSLAWKSNSPTIEYELKSELLHNRLQGNFITTNAGNFAERFTYSMTGSVSVPITIPLSDEFFYIKPHAILRGEYLSDLKFYVSPFAGISLGYSGLPLIIKVNRSYTFRPPAFNELYYQNFGSNTLRPERALTNEISLNVQLSDKLLVESTLFERYTRDQIIAVPRSAIAWSALNIARTYSSGVESSICSQLLDKQLWVRFSHTYQRVTNEVLNDFSYQKQLPYTPEHIISISSSYQFNHYMIGGVFQHVGDRYSQSDNAPNSRMDRYTTLDVYGAMTSLFNTDIAIRIDVRNIFNEQYEVISNFPMPGRILRSTISYQF